MSMQIEKPRTSRSLAVTLAIAFLALSVIVLLIAGGFQIFFNVQTQQETVASRQRFIAQDAANTVASFVQGKFDVLEAAARFSDPSLTSQEEQARVLANLLSQEPAFRHLVLLDSQGRELAKSTRISEVAAGNLVDRAEGVFAQTQQGERYVGPVYIDEVTSEPMIVMAVPVTDAFGDFQGVLLAEVNLKFMWDLMERLEVGEGGQAYVVDRYGRLIAFGDVTRVLRGENVKDLREVGEFVGSTALVDETGANISTGINGTSVVGTYVPLGTPDWAVVTELPVAEAYRAVIQSAALSAGVMLVMAVVAGLLGVYVARRLAVPLHTLTETATRIAGGETELQARMEGPAETVGLAKAFNSMTAQLHELIDGLETRTRALALAADVGRRLSTVRDLDALLGEAVELIRSSFGLYYAQVYLTDPAGRDLILRAGTGEAGAALVRRGHTLPVGPGSINGTAAAEKRAIIVSDTAQSAVFKPNPLLPDTRSEMAVPLMVGGQVVGVLNLQHNQPGSLTSESLPVFETLAGQFAIAVDNANLFAETAQARAEVEAQLKRMARTGWQDFMDGIQRSERIGYAYAGDTLEPIAEPLAATAGAHVLAASIQVQEAPVGVIQIEGKAGRAWTEAETELVESVARQVAQQVENLRILAQADQYRAEAEQATRRLTREGWQDYLAAKAESSAGFVYDRYEVKPLTGEASAMAEAGEPALTRPLQVHGETIGRLSLGEVAALNDEAAGLIDTVAERLSAHIESLRLFEETRIREHELGERSRELAASQRVTFAATETTDPDELLDLVVNLIRDQFGLYHAQVYLVDEKKQAAVLRKSTGYAGRQLLERGHQIPLKQASLVTKAIREGEPVVVDDVSKEKSWTPDPLLPDTHSELVLPLKTSEGVIGALDVLSRTPGTFTPHTVALFQTMAEQVAMNFQTTDLLTRTTEQAETLTRYAGQLHTAAEVTERVSAILNPDQLMNEVVELLQSRFGLYHAHIYLLDDPPRELLDRADPEGAARISYGHRLFMRAGSGEVGRVLRERGHSIPLDAEHSLVARAVRSRETSVVNDTSRESDFMPNPLLPQTRSELTIPLVIGSKVLGVLDVQDDQPGRFGQSDVATFSTLAGQVATALQNAAFFEEIQQASERLRELDRLKSEFLANMSHELRTPLNSIIGYAELMLLDMEGTVDPETLEDVQAIHDNGKHLLRLINDVLDLAKIEAGQLELSFEQVQIEPLLDAARASAIGLLVDRPIEMRVEIEENLPAINADPLRLGQILNNLVSNAVKFTEEGAITLRAFADGDGQGEAGWVHIQVEDTGIGISEEDQTLIFERFRQADSSFTRRGEGTGLGLSITRHLAHLHGGEVEVRSQLGKGSTFTVHLPIRGPEAEAAARLESSQDGV
jgi:signal transduction histidine kinase